MDEAFGGVDRVDAEGMVALRDSIRRHRLPMLVFPALRSHAYERRVSEYASILGTLYHAIQKVSGCNVVVDSSKAPYNALLVSEIPNVQASLIHLVRDSRAVAHSWQRRKRRAESPQQMVYMERYTPTQTAVSWSMSNVLTPIAARRFANHTVLRYEDLAAEPRQVLIDLARWLGADSSAFPFVSNDVVTLESDHALWGNPNRFETGPVRIRPDDEWRTTMNRRSRHVVTALTVPLLWKYGYLTRSQPDVVQPAAISPGP
jgi:hypothetical protein